MHLTPFAKTKCIQSTDERGAGGMRLNNDIPAIYNLAEINAK